MEPPISDKKFILNNGVQMPAVGFGTYRIKDVDDVMKSIDAALAAGYRMFDTASVYRNERMVGAALKKYLPKYDLDRDDIFITTKLSPNDHGTTESVVAAYERSLNNLDMERVDLYLIHFPGSSKLRSDDPRNMKLRERSWSALADLYDDGRVNAVGVSNYTIKHLTDLMNENHGVVPAVNQVEWHPFYHQQDLLEFCNSKEIVLQAYSALGGASQNDYKLITHPLVKKIAAKHSVTAAQVLLRWTAQKEISILPKSINPERICQNIDLNIVLTNDEMKKLDRLIETNETKYAWNPSEVF